MRKRRAFDVQTLHAFFYISGDKCEIKFFNRLIRPEKRRSGEIVLEKWVFLFFFFCRSNTHTIASNGSRIDRIANSAHRVNISYRTDRRMAENISFFMRKGGALDTVRKLSNALGL